MADKKLTAKQARFVEEYLISLNGTHAYRTAYPHIKNDETAKAAGSRLLTNVNVRKAIAQSQKERQQRTKVSQDTVINDLLRISRKSEAAGRYGDALKAQELLARHVRFFTDTVDINITQPPRLVVNFTRPKRQMGQTGKPALQEGGDFEKP